MIFVEKTNEQGKSNPRHILNTTPSLNCYTLTPPSFILDTRNKTSNSRNEEATSLQMQSLAVSIAHITADTNKELRR